MTNYEQASEHNREFNNKGKDYKFWGDTIKQLDRWQEIETYNLLGNTDNNVLEKLSYVCGKISTRRYKYKDRLGIWWRGLLR